MHGMENVKNLPSLVKSRFIASLDSNLCRQIIPVFFNKVSCVDLRTTCVPPIEMYVFTKYLHPTKNCPCQKTLDECL